MTYIAVIEIYVGFFCYFECILRVILAQNNKSEKHRSQLTTVCGFLCVRNFLHNIDLSHFCGSICSSWFSLFGLKSTAKNVPCVTGYIWCNICDYLFIAFPGFY